VTYLGRLVKHKRPDELVRHWKRLSALPGLSPARLDIYGFDPTGEMLEELRRFVIDSQLTDRVQIHGKYDNEQLPAILAETDLVVLPSLEEGLPLVLVEAMSRGVPFVATDAGGTEELAEGNRDVIVTGQQWAAFENGLVTMARKVRSGEIDPQRLHEWTEKRYGFPIVSKLWLDCLGRPHKFFGLDSICD
jgi:glycosyltransferase involved in cell wall biosynthesis